jgi:hypothetical protein
MSKELQTAVNDSIAAARRNGLKSKGDIASYVAQDPSVRAMARQSDGQLNMAALAVEPQQVVSGQAESADWRL